MLVITELEYREFLEWATANMPDGLTVVNTGHDLAWLAANPGMLFPQDANTAAKWFRIVQQNGQASYHRSEGLDAILIGRRRSDGNYVGRGGANIYTAKGVTRYSPLSEWSHEDVLAAIHWHYGAEGFAPCYGWPRGFRVGTGPWPARQWTTDEAHGWSEVWAIDPEVVIEASRLLPGALAHCERMGAGL